MDLRSYRDPDINYLLDCLRLWQGKLISPAAQVHKILNYFYMGVNLKQSLLLLQSPLPCILALIC